MSYVPVEDAASSLISRVSKAVAAAIGSGLTAGGGVLASSHSPVQAVVAAAVAVLTGFTVTYVAPANKR